MNSVHEEVEGIDILVERDILHPGVLSMKNESVDRIFIKTEEQDSNEEPHPKFNVSNIRNDLHRLAVRIHHPRNIGDRD